jgi:hypothetical protein
MGSRRAKLRVRITKWRDEQTLLMPKAGDAVARQRSCEVEHEILFLPSDFPCDQRHAVEAVALGIEEAKLREGEAFDALRATQNAVKTMTALLDRKRKNARGQADNTRASNYIREAQGRRDHHMRTYAACRTAMIALGTLDTIDPQSPFPPLSLEDTYMKSTQRGRGLGDSRRTDGMLWRKHGQAVETDNPPVAGASSDICSDETKIDASKSEYCPSFFVRLHS